MSVNLKTMRLTKFLRTRASHPHQLTDFEEGLRGREKLTHPRELFLILKEFETVLSKFRLRSNWMLNLEQQSFPAARLIFWSPTATGGAPFQSTQVPHYSQHQVFVGVLVLSTAVLSIPIDMMQSCRPLDQQTQQTISS